MRRNSLAALLLSARALSAGPPAPVPPTVALGPLDLAPAGFLESITAIRSPGSSEGISTRFGALPLGRGGTQAVSSFGHSRIIVEGKSGRWRAYYESDFLRRAPDEPYRIRQFFGEVKLGKWELSAGREFSLLRPNREGISSERSLMNTRVADPAYHVGLAGVRNQQVRAIRRMGGWNMAISFEDGRDGLVKFTHDSPRLHWEAMAVGGRRGHHGGGIAAIWRATPHIQLVTQQYAARGGGVDALGTAAQRVPAFSTIEGVETSMGKWQPYGYAGLVYAARAPGNRTVRQITGGLIRELARDRVGDFTLNVQLSRLDRSVWQGAGVGRQTLVMLSLRHTFGAMR